VAAPRESPPAPPSIRDARARGVEFRASGNEPGWVLEMFADRLVFVGDYGATRASTPRPALQEQPGSGERAYAAVTEAHRLTVRVRRAPCVDTMSGEQFEASVEVELDGRPYRGCGRELATP
jgi:putative lipoprotein